MLTISEKIDSLKQKIDELTTLNNRLCEVRDIIPDVTIINHPAGFEILSSLSIVGKCDQYLLEKEGSSSFISFHISPRVEVHGQYVYGTMMYVPIAEYVEDEMNAEYVCLRLDLCAIKQMKEMGYSEELIDNAIKEIRRSLLL